ncbi:hypothetical protein NM688_g3404 [Phlebia brevispora]|uniref:Uncharacterized protein n=1 Tax=Phlebia brevispora TaxID=194682 RepID=A0ACC1T5M1_9APHY|nr:hypothetical protein NM688_g3404 [Phlebia brevispora]
MAPHLSHACTNTFTRRVAIAAAWTRLSILTASSKMSGTLLRKRIPFAFSAQEDEDERILDEQEQEEVIQDLKERIGKQSNQYALLLQVVTGLSLLLHLIYICKKPPRYSPLEALFPSDKYIPKLPLPFVFSLLHILVHLCCIVRLLATSNPVHVAVASSCPPLLSYTTLFGASSAAPVLCLLTGGDWRDIAWWAVADAVILLLWIAEHWAAEEAKNIRKLESMRYDARGA